ncbi:InlB B-repeat-containing protein [Methanomethylophilus alvi]|uniref:InlB B-repeat-containing protein n=1 Tax=Methanomethylophilus alvi TaxID=1291540 RepID=UPI0037DC5EBC
MMRARLTSEQVAAIAVSIVCIVTVAAVLTLTWDDSPDGTRSLSVETSGHGTVSYEDSYPFGTVADVWITPDDGYVIYGITVDGEPVGLTNNLNVFMDRDRDIFIDFREASSDDVEVEVDVSITEVMGIIVTGGIGDVSKTYEWGTLTPGGTISVVPGTSVTFTLTLADGYRFVDMRINGNEVPPSETFVVGDITADMSIELWLMKTDVDPGMYVIHAEHNGHGSVTPSDCEVAAGGSVTLTVSPNDGYMVSSVLVNYSEVELSDGKLVLSDIDGNKVVSVTFEEIEYTETVTVSVGDNGTVSPSGSVVVERGEDLELTITPDDGYRIASVILDGTDVTSEVKDSVFILSNVVSGHSVSVVFERIVYTVEISYGVGGSVSPSGDVPVAYGDDLSITISPDAGYALFSVTLDGDEVTSEVKDSVYVLSDVTSNHAVRVYFEKFVYTVSISSGMNGTVSPSGDVPVAYGDDLTISIVPDEGYRISKVTMDGEDVTSSVTGQELVLREVKSNHDVTVAFEKITYTVAVSSGGHGSVDPDGDVLVECGDSLTVKIAPDTGYVLKSVILDGIDVTSSVSGLVFVLNDVVSDHSVRVEFEVITYTVTVTAGENGSADPTTSVVEYGKSLKIVFIPEPGYRTSYLTINGGDRIVPDDRTNYVIDDIIEDKAVEVFFERDDSAYASVSVAIVGHGTVNGNSDSFKDEVLKESSYTITSVPSEGYRLSKVLVDNVEVPTSEGVYFLNDIARDTAVEVVFEILMFTVTVDVGEHGSCDQQTQAVEYGSDLTFTFTPDSRYAVHSVTVDGVPVEIVDGTYVLRDIRADHVVAVTFWKAEFDIEISAGKNGSASPSGVQSVDRGGSLTVSFVPDDKYAVCSVKVDGEEVEITGNAYTFSSVSADHILVVTFRQVEFDIGISAGENGSASPSGIQRVQENESLTVVFTPSEGYTYDFVLVDGEEGTLTNGTYVFSNVLADHEISVTFKRIVITVSIDPTEGGSVEASSEAPYYYGDPLTLTFTPDVWYGLKSVTVNGVDVTAQLTDSKYVFSALTEDQTVSAVFEKYTVVDRIEVEGPSKTVYASSENTLDTSGLTVTAYYTDGSSRVVTDYELSPTDLTGKSGVVTVTVRYSESYSNTDKTVEASFSVKKASGEFTAYVTEYNGAAVNERLSQYVFDLKGLEPGGDAITFKVKVSDETGLSGVDFNACVWVQNLQDSSKNCALSKNIILTAESGGNRLFSGDLYGIADGSGQQTDVGSVPASGMEITFTLRMSSSAGSDTMNQSLSFNLGVYAYDVEGQ